MAILTSIALTVFWILALCYSGKCDSTMNRNQSNICLDCLEATQVNKCNIPFCELDKCINIIDINNFTKYETNGLKLVCRDDLSLTFKWNSNKNTYFFMEYYKEGFNELYFTNLSMCNFQTIQGLNPNEKYKIRLYSFSMKFNMLFGSKRISAFTSKISSPRTAVKKLNYTLTPQNESYRATVTWRPGEDQSCLYEILWFLKGNEAGNHLNHIRVNLKKRPVPEFNISSPDLGRKYEFSIKSVDRNGEKESIFKSVNIVVPSCLDEYKNISICPPEKPKNLTLSIVCTGAFLNINLSWNKPRFQPNYYNATLVSNVDILTVTSLNISGINDDAIFENIELGVNHRIQLTAHSHGGISNPAYIDVPYKFCEEPSTNYVQGIWILSTLSAVTVLLAVVFAFKTKLRYFLLQYFDLKQRIDEAIVKYVINDREDLKWELNESKLTIKEVIGVGAFGVVQKGWYYVEKHKQSEVAVKMLKARPTDEQITQFYDEIEIMKSVPHHTHIVFLLGVITKSRPNNPFMLVEYCAKGDLQTFLRNVWLVLGDSNSNSYKYPAAAEYSDNCTNKFYDLEESCLLKKEHVLQSKDLLSFARQIVLGMEFLSGLKMIHRDLAARNILLNDQYTIKISDFGLCRDIYTNNVYQKVTGGKLPFRWMALESLTHQVYTTESDVWSFGIVLWEIVTLGGDPFPTVKTENLIYLLKENYRMESPINCSEEIYNIMLKCWEARPSERPTFTELRETFDKLLESEVQYISLEDVRKLDLNHYENTRDSNMEILSNSIK